MRETLRLSHFLDTVPETAKEGEMEREIREFLQRIAVDELVARGVLNPKGNGYLLQGVNVAPLIGLMRERGITRLTSSDNRWSLTVEGMFSNPHSREAKSGLYESLERHGNVFWSQNRLINPYF